MRLQVDGEVDCVACYEPAAISEEEDCVDWGFWWGYRGVLFGGRGSGWEGEG